MLRGVDTIKPNGGRLEVDAVERKSYLTYGRDVWAAGTGSNLNTRALFWYIEAWVKVKAIAADQETQRARIVRSIDPQGYQISQ